jgi:hypothetical protein
MGLKKMTIVDSLKLQLIAWKFRVGRANFAAVFAGFLATNGAEQQSPFGGGGARRIRRERVRIACPHYSRQTQQDNITHRRFGKSLALAITLTTKALLHKSAQSC